MKNFFAAAAAVTSARHAFHPVASFVAPSSSSSSRTSPSTARLSAAATILGEDVPVPDAETEATSDLEERRRALKRALLCRLGGGPSSSSSSSSSSYAGDESPSFDPILADPLTKDPLRASFVGPILGGGSARSGVRLALTSPLDPDRVFGGRTDTYVNLLEPAPASADDDEDVAGGSKTAPSPILSSLLAFVPPPLRSIIANVTNNPNGGSPGVEYVPMRDLFTSPSVSFAYERGWRQGFAAAGFPGADGEFELANEYFAPVIERNGVLVDMSCATGELVFASALISPVLSLRHCCDARIVRIRTPRGPPRRSLADLFSFSPSQVCSRDDSSRARNTPG